MARVLVGGFSMEANTFARGETTLDDLRAGEKLGDVFAKYGIL